MTSVTPHVRRSATAAAVLSLLVAAACADPAAPDMVTTGTAPGLSVAKATKGGIPGEYIVVFNDDVADVDGKVKEKESKHGAKAKLTFRHALKGFAGAMTDKEAAALALDPDVLIVEQDQVVQIGATQTGAVYGIDRIDQRARPLSGTYTYTSTGTGVRAYIIDTGILPTHTQFGSRAMAVYDGVGGNGVDCNGHGTHVAGTIGGSTYGVAKNVMLRGVRVFTCSGSSANSTIIAAIDWVRANHIKPAVANMSLGGGFSSATNTAVQNLINAGVFVAVAAGNENQNACNVSPASLAAATTVGATTSTDARATYSNYGSCVDLYAPGSGVRSAWYTSNTATNTISGTSMATPHVVGVAALYKAARGDASQATIDSWLKTNSTANVVSGNISGTPNRLLFKSTL